MRLEASKDVKMKTRIVTLIIFTLAATGCATQQMWYLHGKTEADLHAVNAACWNHVNQIYAGSDTSLNQTAYNAGYAGGDAIGLFAGLALLNQSAKNSAHESCMNSYGFTKAN